MKRVKKVLLLLLLPLLFACSSAPAPENGRLQNTAALSDLLGNGAVTITLTERKG